MAKVKAVAVTMGMRVVAARVAAAKEVARAEAMQCVCFNVETLFTHLG